MVEITLTSAGTVACVVICGIACIYFGGKALSLVIEWLSRQWYYSYAQISFIYEPESEENAETAEAGVSSSFSPDPFDDDDDYYDDEDNFGGRQRIGFGFNEEANPS